MKTKNYHNSKLISGDSDNGTVERENSCGVVADVLDCNIVVKEFELQSRY